jgi:hypothetical protein
MNIKIFCAVACFLPGLAKDLSAPLYNWLIRNLFQMKTAMYSAWSCWYRVFIVWRWVRLEMMLNCCGSIRCRSSVLCKIRSAHTNKPLPKVARHVPNYITPHRNCRTVSMPVHSNVTTPVVLLYRTLHVAISAVRNCGLLNSATGCCECGRELWVSENVLTGWGTVSLSRRILLHIVI